MNDTYKLIAFDLDGTLLANLNDISDENMAAIRTLYERGVKIIPTSGRGLYELPDSVLGCPYFEYLITSGGACTYEAKTRKLIDSRLMTKEQSRFLFELLFSYDTVTMTHYDGDVVVDIDLANEEYYDKCRVTKSFKEFIPDKDRAISDFKATCFDMDGVELTCSFFVTDDDIADFKKRINEKGGYCLAASARDNVEVTADICDKGRAVLTLAGSLGIDQSEIIAAGDSKNDVSMLRAVGHGIAVSNAMDELKAVADAIGCSNKEHIAKYILENYF